MELEPKPEINIEAGLRELGLITTAGGVQIDINTVPRRKDSTVYDAHLCDHNCTTDSGGGYDCPAAFTLLDGAQRRFPDQTLLAQAIATAADGVRTANQQLITSGTFDAYMHTFRIPPEVGEAIMTTLNKEVVQVNIFGGNPEMHEGIFELAHEITRNDDRVNLSITTTGRKSLRDANWIPQMDASPISTIALSCDDITPQLLEQTAHMTAQDLYESWRALIKSSPLRGAQQKALESLYTARLLSEQNRSTPFIFNLVIHRGNLHTFFDLVNTLSEQFPKAQINPFPAQSSMESNHDHRPVLFEPNDVAVMEKIIDWALKVHKGEIGYPLVERMHYWVMLQAALVSSDNKQRQCEALSGYGVWNCYDRVGAARYVQVGASMLPWREGKTTAGGHLGCFWNQTVTNHEVQIWNQTPHDVAQYVTGNIHALSQRTPNPCAGCIMPRLTFDLMSQELGLNPQIIHTYLELRKSHIGF